MPASAVIGALDPGHDLDPKFLAGRPCSAVQHVALQQREEAFHGRIVASSPDPTHRTDHVVAAQGTNKFPATKLRPAIGMQHTASHITSTHDSVIEGRYGQS